MKIEGPGPVRLLHELHLCTNSHDSQAQIVTLHVAPAGPIGIDLMTPNAFFLYGLLQRHGLYASSHLCVNIEMM